MVTGPVMVDFGIILNDVSHVYIINIKHYYNRLMFR